MKTNRHVITLILSIITALAVVVTFSCNGLFETVTPPHAGLGTLSINLPGSGARTGVSPDDITHYSVTIVDDTTGEITVPPQTVTGNSLSLAVPVGNVSVIIVAMVQRPDGTFSMPYIGRKANIQITENETVAATVNMAPTTFGIFEPTNHYPNRIQIVNGWNNGTLPEIHAEGFTFNGWYSDSRKTEQISYFPDTTNYDSTDPLKFTPPFAHFTWLGDPRYVRQDGGGQMGRQAGDSKYFYIAQNARGDGKGYDASNAMGFSDMSQQLYYFSEANPNVVPEVIFITDVSFDFNHIGTVNITGKNNGEDGQRITITGTNSIILSLAGNATDIIFDGKNAGTFQVDYGKTVTLDNCIITNCTTGIDNSGTLILSGCTIEDCSNNYSNESVGAINNSGWSSKLIIRNNTIIDNCSGGKGGAIMIGNGSELDVDGLTITGCSAENGGGIYIDGSEKVTLKNCTITNCTAKENSSFTYHNQSYDGAGIYIRYGKLTLGDNCSIESCTADGKGNSIYCTVHESIADTTSVVNETSWNSEHWINDNVTNTSNFTSTSELWLSN